MLTVFITSIIFIAIGKFINWISDNDGGYLFQFLGSIAFLISAIALIVNG